MFRVMDDPWSLPLGVTLFGSSAFWMYQAMRGYSASGVESVNVEYVLRGFSRGYIRISQRGGGTWPCTVGCRWQLATIAKGLGEIFAVNDLG